MFVQQKQLGTSSTGPSPQATLARWPQTLHSSYWLRHHLAAETGHLYVFKEASTGNTQHAVAPEQGYPKDIHKGFPDIPERKALDLTMMVLSM